MDSPPNTASSDERQQKNASSVPIAPMLSREQVKNAVNKLGQNAAGSSTSNDNKKLGKILRHVQHFLLQLGWNVDSLSAAMECVLGTVLAENWVPSIQQARTAGEDDTMTTATSRHRNAPSLDDVMQHVFSTLLRLHDGLILITSGECRHDEDVKRAMSSKFPSHLTRNAYETGGDSGGDREGGLAATTTVYRSHGVYSGTGWDEWSDPRNGLQVRLLRAVDAASGRRPSSSSSLSWHALSKGTGIEAMLERLETEIRNLEDTFGRLKATVERALVPPLQRTLRASNVKVRLTFQCKMERMAVQAPAAKYNMEWKRLAGQFQLGESVLPQRISREEWQKMLSVQCPSTASVPLAAQADLTANNVGIAHKRKRQCLLDDSDDEEKHVALARDKSHAASDATRAAAPKAAIATVTATGLVVQQKQTRRDEALLDSQAANGTPSDSINDIKAAMGVDVTDLEASHAVLQEEEDATKDEAQRIDSLEESESAERKYKAIRKELDRALRKSQAREEDDDVIWDLRDGARLAAMEAGNQNLVNGESDPGRNHDAVDRRASLERALFFFKQALELVEDQQRFHDRMTRRRRVNEGDLTSGLFRRNLLFLKGQAHVNAGIALAELYRLKLKSSRKNHAMEQFDLALRSVESLRDQARSDNHSSIDAKLDEIKANELRLLVCRWRCTLNWISGDRNQAIHLFQKITSGEASIVEAPIESNECAEAALKERIELYHWCVTLADLVADALEAAALSRIRYDASEYDSLLSLYDEAVNAAARQSGVLHNAVGQLDAIWLPDADILDENGILPEHELHLLLQETKSWWARKKSLSLQPIQGDETQLSSWDDPSTEVAGFTVENAAMPANAPRRLVVYGSSTFPKKSRPRPAALGVGSGNVKVTTNRRPPRPEPRKYRRWGDELLPQVLDENGRLVPKLEYPTLAPEMPPDIKELFDSLRLQSAR